MARKSKTKTLSKKPAPTALEIDVRPGETGARAVARSLMGPTVQAASTIQTFEKSDFELQGFIDELSAQVDAVQSRDMGRSEAVLITQAHTLNELFNTLARRAAANMGEYMNAAETYLRLALKAQSQCRATLETLSTIMNPPVVYARQANIAHNQQVNNEAIPRGRSPRTRENENPQNKLLEEKDAERLDPRATEAAGKADPDLATLGSVDRAKVSRR